uniref:Uncharacterized protein n=1 Tax=Tanacetum cinerariifolium TaxID=118510 RepID=A0A6L2J9W9_TANCI|nr:hypothetical protein [Tanacetum cinerariifolium]
MSPPIIRRLEIEVEELSFRGQRKNYNLEDVEDFVVLVCAWEVVVVGGVVRGGGGEQATVVVVVCCNDVVLRESYKPKTRGKLYYACPRSKPRQNTLGCEIFMKRRTRSSTPPRYSPGASTPQSYSPGSSGNAECSNCKHLLDKITILEATVKMYMHPEQHTVNSAALLHEVYNDIGKLDLE